MSETYFLGAVSGGAFRTEFGRIIADSSYYTYILKGGPGTGKSSLMNRIAAHFEGEHKVIRYCCSSDPASLDAVVIPSLHTAVCDGTSPHVFEPLYPGVCQRYIDLGSLWDDGALMQSRTDIIAAADRNRSLLSRSQRFASAAADICSDTFRLGADCLLPDKLEAYASRTAKRLFGKKTGGDGQKHIRRLTALTEHGFLTHHETLSDYTAVYTVSDELCAAADYLLSRLADEACARGLDVILSPDQMLSAAAYQHLLTPSVRTAFISGRAAEECSHPAAKRLSLMRFYSKELLTERRVRIRMNRRTADDLAAEAARTIRQAKLAHDELEAFYISAMDHPALDKLTGQLISEIAARQTELGE